MQGHEIQERPCQYLLWLDWLVFGSSYSAAWVAVGVVVAKSLAAGGLHHQHLLLSVAPPCLLIHTA